MIEFEELFKSLGVCDLCTNLKKKNSADCSLINFYSNQEMCRKIPSIWTDWTRRTDADIMIIGQDWGPFLEMEKLYKKYLEDETIENWETLIESEKSLTKRNLEKFLKTSANLSRIKLSKDFMKKIYITNAIMCARKGENYRSNNIDLKVSTLNCKKYLYQQIDIIKPKIIVTLGYYPLLSLSKIYGFSIEKNLTNTICKNEAITFNDFTIIPMYHPAAQISFEKQIERYKLIWECLKSGEY